ncbi:MAG: AAA family ATPase [Desulfobacterales bacterium]|nr:AAA family ATPase [Desulfobacterales bacterium]
MRLPYGISNFLKLVEEGYYFVDRTNYIEELENEPEPYIFFLRPRRFGKSLMISILHHYYGLEHKTNFSKLFGKYYIGNHPTAKANSYYILKFEFSRIDTITPESTKHSFRINVLSGIYDFETYYGYAHKDYGQNDEPANILKRFFSEHFSKKIYLLIDEYDHFANEILSFRFEFFAEIVSRTGFVRKFYETIKAATAEGIVDRLFVTGVTPITLDSLTSGFNIAANLSLKKKYNAMMGFTEREVKEILDTVCPESEDKNKVILDMRAWYNGYLFNIKGHERVYNPDMVLYFCKELMRESAYPDNIIDFNIASDYGKIRKLFDLKNGEQNYQVLDMLIQENRLNGQITEQFSFEKPFSRDDFISLLFYMGFITLQTEMLGEKKFQIPNFVLKGLYLQFFIELVQIQSGLCFETVDVRKFLIALAQDNNPKPFLNLIENTLKRLSNRDFVQFNEKYIKALFVAFVSLVNLYYVKSEMEIDRKYPDLMLMYRPPFFPNYQFVFELKYLKLSESEKLKDVTSAAINQIEKYLKTDEIKALKNLKAYVIVFVGTEVMVLNEVLKR